MLKYVAELSQSRPVLSALTLPVSLHSVPAVLTTSGKGVGATHVSDTVTRGSYNIRCEVRAFLAAAGSMGVDEEAESHPDPKSQTTDRLQAAGE